MDNSPWFLSWYVNALPPRRDPFFHGIPLTSNATLLFFISEYINKNKGLISSFPRGQIYPLLLRRTAPLFGPGEPGDLYAFVRSPFNKPAGLSAQGLPDFIPAYSHSSVHYGVSVHVQLTL